MRYASVFIKNQINKLGNLFTYEIQDNLDVKVGCRVLVPFGRGNNKKIAFVVKVFNNIEEPYYRIKKILEIIDHNPIINKDLIDLGFWMKEEYLTTYLQSFMPILPPGDEKKIYEYVSILKTEDLSKDEGKFISIIKKNNYSVDFIYKDKDKKNILENLIDKKVLDIYFKIKTLKGEKFKKFVKLDEEYLKKLKESTFSISDKQYSIIQYLQNNNEVEVSKLLIDLKISNSPVKTLSKKGLISIFDKKVTRDYNQQIQAKNAPILNKEQVEAYEGILKSDKKVNLLFGMTGSGKTEVYMSLCDYTIKSEGQVIILVPEIGLTPQMVNNFMSRFKGRVSVLHSKLSIGERYDQWQKIKNNEVDIVVGVRSAIFAPFKNLKMIIIDEAHDISYGSHDSLRYDTLKVAEKRMKLLDGKLVLGSATPKIESYYKALNKEYGIFKLTKRAVKGSKLPNTHIVDMKYEIMNGNTSILSSKLHKLIEDRLEKKEQIILFLNRRGFSNFVSCRTCGQVIKCENCDISMTYHKENNILRCHYCGSTKKMMTQCPSCKSKYIKQFGIGTQKVEEEIKKIFPKAKILRMDRDTTSKKDAYKNIYQKMKENEVDILIGTQMLAKGLDFKNLTLVGVISADLSLYTSDFRASETTFQLLTQVSGRAGRSEKQGDVVIQTYNPDEYSIVNSANADYIKFYEKELEIRKKFGYPPYTNMISLTFSSKSEEYALNTAQNFLYKIGMYSKNFKFEYSRVIRLAKIKNIYKYKFTIKINPQNYNELIKVIKGVLIRLEDYIQKNNIFIDIEFM